MAAGKVKRRRKKVLIGHEADGTPIIKWANGYTKKEVAEHAERIRKEHVYSAQEVERDAVFRVYAQRYYNEYRRDRVSLSQRVNIASAMNNHILPHIGEKRMVAVSAMDLQGVMNKLQGSGKTLIGDVYTILRTTFSHAYAGGVIDRDPSVGLVLPTTRKPDKRRALTAEETKAVLHLGENHADGLLLLMLYYLGLRRGEALGGKWGDVDFVKAEYHVLRDIDFISNDEDTLKSEASERTLPIPDALMAVLRAKRGLPGAYIIQSSKGSYWGATTYKRHWDALRIAMSDLAPSIEKKDLVGETSLLEKQEKKRAEKEKREPQAIPPVYGSVITAHYLRHNYASILYADGVDVLTAQKLLGHADPKTTLSIYTHLKEAQEKVKGDVVRAAFAREHDNLHGL